MKEGGEGQEGDVGEDYDGSGGDIQPDVRCREAEEDPQRDESEEKSEDVEWFGARVETAAEAEEEHVSRKVFVISASPSC